jgi:hypothetical protein
MEVLLVEDDDTIAVPLVKGLEREGFAVTRVARAPTPRPLRQRTWFCSTWSFRTWTATTSAAGCAPGLTCRSS